MLRILFALAFLCFAATSRGQTLNDDLAPGLSREDYKAIVTRLDLDKDRREAADRVYEGYAADHSREAAAFKAAFDNLSRTGHVDLNTGKFEEDAQAEHAFEVAITKYNAFKPKAKAQVISDVKALLTQAEVAEQWPGVDRFVRRMLMHSVLFNSPVSWARADISKCVADLKLPPDPLAKVRPLLDEYELAIDKPLRRMEGLWGQDTEDSRRSFREASREVGSLNKRYLRVVAQDLPPEDAAHLTAAAKGLAYWTLYRNDGHFIRERLSEAKKLASFSADQQKRADTLLADIDKAVAQFRNEATPDYDETDAKVEGMSQKEWDDAMNREDNPFMKLSEKWDVKFSDSWMEWVERMKAILTDEQRRELWPPEGDPFQRKR